MAAPLDRRHVRLKREYLYRRSLEGSERETYEKKRKIQEALASGKPVPSELRSEAGELQRLLQYDDSRLAAAPGGIDDEYARTLRGERLAKICVCTSRDPSSRLKQFAKELKHLFPNATRVNRGNTKISELVDATRSAEFSDLVMVHETRGQPDGLIVSRVCTCLLHRERSCVRQPPLL
jgi:U3 small nucleolar ribonucleoprotein protein IMP4